MKDPVLEMRNIKKTFPGGVIANDSVNFCLKEGEIHALLGENGAGKTTLMNILFGLYRQDEGIILLQGEEVTINSPGDALQLGIGMIHQHFTLVPSFSVLENIILGLNDKGFRPDYKEIEGEIGDLSSKFGLKVDPRSRAWQLSVGERQRVEILKLLYRETRILIMDEPTAVLTPQEVNKLFLTLRKMTVSGYSIIFITHKLEEVKAVTDRVTVLRKGRVVGSYDTANISAQELARKMVGQTLAARPIKRQISAGDTVLELKGLEADNDKGLPALRGLNISVKEGEVLGIAGVAGNGQKELAEVISGLRPVKKGEILLRGRNLAGVSTRKRIKLGLSFIPEDRLEMGIAAPLSLKENLILKGYREAPFCRAGIFIDEGVVTDYAMKKMDEYRVVAPDPETIAGLLSGGNIQKIILARELSANPQLILAVHPTRGLDISAIDFVYRTLLKEKEEGKAILLIAGDLEEIFSLSDRVLVIFAGEIVGELPADEKYLEEIGMLMAGATIKTE